ncbi:hypothetical protein SAMN04488556_3968 [Halostagnicola kamekurae]|uniref:Uncharacterized protein n=1 Tax=Halostagnicola kamekurae TaxID=619731 RepID=A0A1I6UNS5_9EURY|nr:hypothetical protein SAMN04488556_3968 [Halostagnicola kamekurae]
MNRLIHWMIGDNIGVVVYLEQRETLAVVESAIRIDSFDFGIKAVAVTRFVS